MVGTGTVRSKAKLCFVLPGTYQGDVVREINFQIK